MIEIIKTDRPEWKTRLGQNGTGFFNTGSPIQIGDAAIRIGQRLEVSNTGSDLIRVAYRDTGGSEKTMLLGEGGTGYFSRATAIQIGDANIRVVNAP